jgi:hypothetical protein
MLLLAIALLAALTPAPGQIIGPPRDVETQDGIRGRRSSAVIIIGLAPGTPLRAEYEAAVRNTGSAAGLAERLGAIAGVPLDEVTLRSGGDVSVKIDSETLMEAIRDRLRAAEGVQSVWSIVPETRSIPQQPPEALVRLRADAALDPVQLDDLAPTRRQRVDNSCLVVSLDMEALIEVVTARLSAADGIAYVQSAFPVGIQ